MAEMKTDLARNKLGVGSIVFLVLAAVAPVTVLIVVLPIAIALGNGGGVPVAVLLVAAALLLFAVGYAQITKELTNAGGFYAIAVKGLGRIAGLITGLIAAIGYNVFVAAGLGTIGFFAGMQAAPTFFGVELDWFYTGAVVFIIVFLLAISGIHVSAIVLGVALVLEVIMVLVFGFSVLIQHGFDFAVFSPTVIMGGSLWIGLLLAATAFLGFEATALFGEEAKEPRKTIPRATYIAILAIGLMHAFGAWAIVSAVGVSEAQGVGLDHLAEGDLTIGLIIEYLGDFGLYAALFLLVVSVFAAQLAFHNSAGRYLFALGRARVLPHWFAKTNSKGAPARALLVNLIIGILIAAIFRFAFPDLPSVVTVVPVGLGFATLSIMIVQTIAALAIVVYYRRKGDSRLWSTLIAPGLGFLALLTFSIMALANFGTVAGSEETYVLVLPWILPVTIVIGLVFGLFLKSKKPEVYQGLSNDLEKFEEALEEETAHHESA